MRVKEALRIVGGSLVVYVVMAACSSEGGVPSMIVNAVDAAVGDVGGTSGDATGNALDAIVNPIPEASAGPLPPIVATESCTQQAPDAGTGVTYLYAEHAFPGYTAQQLAGLQILNNDAFTSIPGYSQSQGIAYIRDGYAAVICGSPTAQSITSVTFILPQ
jgi:hypothetical protein